jgi:hypothetical protein
VIFETKHHYSLLKMASDRRGTTLFPKEGISTTGSLSQQSAKVRGSSNETQELVPRKEPVGEISPWEKYKKFMELDQAGPANMAFSCSSVSNRCKVVAIKSCPLRTSLGSGLCPIRNDRVVQLEEFFICGSEAFLVYEPMAVTLVDLLAIQRMLTSLEIAAICKEVQLQLQAEVPDIY